MKMKTVGGWDDEDGLEVLVAALGELIKVLITTVTAGGLVLQVLLR